MKKLFSVILAMVMAASLFTGCVEKNDPENKVEPTPTPAATPGPVTDVDEDDPNYPTVLAMWKDMDGYWVNEDGEYLFFTLDDNGKAVLYSYDDGGVLDGFMKATAVMSSNKTSYYIAVDLPAVNNNEKLAGLTQSASSKSFMIELDGYGDDYVELAEDDGELDYEIFVKVGNNLDKMKDAIKQAEKLEKDD